jgi:hypothetical protein
MVQREEASVARQCHNEQWGNNEIHHATQRNQCEHPWEWFLPCSPRLEWRHATTEVLLEAVLSVDPCRGYIWRIETAESEWYGLESRRTRTRKRLRWRGPAAIVNNRSILLLERMLYTYKDYNHKCWAEKKYWLWVSRGLTLKMNWLAVNHKS